MIVDFIVLTVFILETTFILKDKGDLLKIVQHPRIGSHICLNNILCPILFFFFFGFFCFVFFISHFRVHGRYFSVWKLNDELFSYSNEVEHEILNAYEYKNIKKFGLV